MKEDATLIYTDGGCRGNPGIGGWGALLSYKGHQKTLSGHSPYTTNNRMELTAAIEALKAIKRPCKILIHTDSAYLKDGITKWIAGWKNNGWKTKDKELVKNIDLWKELDRLIADKQVEWQWVKGHNGDHGNEKVDALANKAMDRYLIDLLR